MSLLGAMSAMAGATSAYAAGDANVASCPNEALEGFRASLPDCRAYEMVSPLFKDGGRLEVTAISGDGTRVLADTKGSFAELEADPSLEGGYYELSRSAHGWSPLAVSPPLSLFSDPGFGDVSPDLEKSLWLMRTPSQSLFARDLYAREANGSFSRVGPLVPPSREAGPPAGPDEQYVESEKVVGASADLSRSLFEIEALPPAGFWPGDTTATQGGTESSLYEYVRGNARPELVGVSDGSTVVNGKVLPAGDLISDCGTSLGSAAEGGQSISVNDRYNAVSATASTVFFTALGTNNALNPNQCEGLPEGPEVNELYARIGQFETVPVSEPSAEECEVCGTPATAGAGRRSAEFAGASEDGSKVFFLTEQELFAGDSTMNLYEYDFDGIPREKVIRVSAGAGPDAATPEVQGVARVSQDGSHVYFVARGRLTNEANADGELPLAGADNLYLFERDAAYPGGRTRFIATLCSGPEESGALTGVSKCPGEASDGGDWSAKDNRPVQATPDGRFLVFRSAGDLVAGDASKRPQIFEYDAQTGELARVSIGQRGYAAGAEHANEHASFIPSHSYTVSAASAPSGVAISNDGARIVFTSEGALTEADEPAAEAGVEGVYEYRSYGAIGDGNVYLVSDGASQQPNNLAGLDPSGEDIYFETSAVLVGATGDTQYHLYDARVGGGFPPVQTSGECEGEACAGSFSPQPSFAPAATALTPGSQGLSSAPPPVTAVPSKPTRVPTCRDGKRRRNGKCMRRNHRRARGKSKLRRRGGRGRAMSHAGKR